MHSKFVRTEVVSRNVLGGFWETLEFVGFKRSELPKRVALTLFIRGQRVQLTLFIRGQRVHPEISQWV